MTDEEAIAYLQNNLSFSESDISKIKSYVKLVLSYNQKYNLISKTTEEHIWIRHILDSAQIVKFVNFKLYGSLSDIGSGAGFPGIVIAIYNKNSDFHVKLYEKSVVKCNFLKDVINKLNINAEVVEGDVNQKKINSNYIVSRAFKKLEKVLYISREMAKKPHKNIILKGKSAQEEINNVSSKIIYRYKLERSITDKNSKIIIFDVV